MVWPTTENEKAKMVFNAVEWTVVERADGWYVVEDIPPQPWGRVEYGPMAQATVQPFLDERRASVERMVANARAWASFDGSAAP